jgi:hypothetical protein
MFSDEHQRPVGLVELGLGRLATRQPFAPQPHEVAIRGDLRRVGCTAVNPRVAKLAIDNGEAPPAKGP